MLEKEQEKSEKARSASSQQPGGGSEDPTRSELPSAWVGTCNSQANQASKMRGEEGKFGLFF